MVGEGRISIWFFIGSILEVYGIIIFIASIYYAGVPDGHKVVLDNLHAGIWWGILLIIIGGMYLIIFRPGKAKKS